ncbi:hypothetical protein [Actinokineospora sp. UTMC 2448]|uniref:hypothetical protein n=1 Tax=Actinokineospora sp. UTMC 2448 TaxID=2268449 RepID=UPI002164600E|nr:hypothetical protein [Actinokineospora sp. UTMC 2448]UVS78413.1 hypothetical protein Actkin_02146 [Actinokineospora sp. UTMC 2448]
MSAYLNLLIDVTLRLAEPAVLTDRTNAPEVLAHPVIIKVFTAFIACLLGLAMAVVAAVLTKPTQGLRLAIVAAASTFAATVLLCLALLSYVLS